MKLPSPTPFFVGIGLMLVMMFSWVNSPSNKNPLPSLSPTSSSDSYVKAALHALYAGDTKQAEYLLKLGSESPPSVLGLSSEAFSEIYPGLYWKSQLKSIEANLRIYPDSRDLWLKKGLLALTIGDEDLLEEVWQKLKLIDPNDPTVKEWEKLYLQ